MAATRVSHEGLLCAKAILGTRDTEMNQQTELQNSRTWSLPRQGWEGRASNEQ